VLAALRDAGATRFHEQTLHRALRRRFHGRVAVTPVTALPRYRGSPTPSLLGDRREVLIVGAGPMVAQHSEALADFVATRRPFVIHCNVVRGADAPDLRVVTNHERLSHAVADVAASRVPVLLGMDEIARDVAPALAETDVFHRPYVVATNTLVIDDGELTLPADVAAMYAIAFACTLRVSRIWLAGFDGYVDQPDTPNTGMLQAEMEQFFRQLRECCAGAPGAPDICSVLPTTYPVRQSSVYEYV
jgi:hypothetical protein